MVTANDFEIPRSADRQTMRSAVARYSELLKQAGTEGQNVFQLSNDVVDRVEAYAATLPAHERDVYEAVFAEEMNAAAAFQSHHNQVAAAAANNTIIVVSVVVIVIGIFLLIVLTS